MRIREAVIALSCWWLVRVPKSAQIRRDNGEVSSKQRQKFMPIKAVLGCTMQKDYCRPIAGSDTVHADAIDPEPVMIDCHTRVIVCLNHYE